MPITHVFATHAMLQEYLVEAIIRDVQIPFDQVLVIRMRKSFRPGEDRPYRVVNGDEFNTTNGRNVLKHRVANRRRFKLFKQEVLAWLAPDFQVFSPMYTYWYLNVLAQKSSAYHILEDGFASYLPREEILKYINLTQPPTGIRKLQKKLVTVPEQRTLAPLGEALLEQAGKFYVTSGLGFSWLTTDRQVIVPSIFPAYAPGEFEDAVIWAPGCLVEAGYLTLADYLSLIRSVFAKAIGRGINTIHYKFHPTQAAAAQNLAAYQQVLEEFEDRLKLLPIAQNVSIECLAAGNKISLITGFSTLSFHVAVVGGEVLTYLDEIAKITPAVNDRLRAAGRAIFVSISKPL